MSIVDRLRGAVRERTKVVSERVTQSYRDKLGENIVKRQSELEALEKTLETRERAILEREANLREYYFVPRRYVVVPMTIFFLVVMYFGVKAISPVFEKAATTSVSSTASETRESSPLGGSSENTIPSYSACVSKGVSYYKEMGSYPTLSTGEDALTKVRDNCGRSSLAFGR